jgi:MoxR-like ATPase
MTSQNDAHSARGPWTQLPRAIEAEKSEPINLPPPITEVLANPEAYLPDDGLITAANVALLLGQPILVTGEPGCGKTAFAFWLARQLGLGKPLADVVKSTSTGRDLLYEFDSLARFRDSQREIEPDGGDEYYVRFRALGAAIAAANPGALSSKLRQRVQQATGDDTVDPRRYVVLIDELDKAPRDTPNDLLHEIDQMDFSVTEIDRKIAGNAAFRPIVVITSNSEKSLPDPFLRRCIYYNIPDLDSADGRTRLRKILDRRSDDIANGGDHELADGIKQHGTASLDKFYALRKASAHKPGTAEFLALTIALARQEIAARRRNSRVDADAIWRAALTAIVKTREDRAKALTAAVARG